MGNSSSHRTGSTEELQQAFVLLHDPAVGAEGRRAAFNLLQQEYAPNLKGTQEYAAVLKALFDQRFTPWHSVTPALKQSATSWSSAGIAIPILSDEILADRIRGCIFGCALGDAVGLATEFMSAEEARLKYGPTHVFEPGAEVFPDTHRMVFPAGDWTDDTDQMILILQSLFESAGLANPALFGAKLAAWSANGFPQLGDKGGAGLGKTTKKVLNHKAFATDPHTAAYEVWDDAGRVMAPNGAVMRTCVTGIPSFWDDTVVDANTLAFCRTTHADPRCAASTLAVARCVALLLRGTDVATGTGESVGEQQTQKVKHDSLSAAGIDAVIQQALDAAAAHLVGSTTATKIPSASRSCAAVTAASSSGGGKGKRVVADGTDACVADGRAALAVSGGNANEESDPAKVSAAATIAAAAAAAAGNCNADGNATTVDVKSLDIPAIPLTTNTPANGSTPATTVGNDTALATQATAATAELMKHGLATTIEELELDDMKGIGYTYKCMGAGLWGLRSVAVGVVADQHGRIDNTGGAASTAFKTMIDSVTKAAGDADTNGAVAGGLAGCYLGYNNLPHDWVGRMPYGEWLESHVQKLLFMLQLPTTASG